jgi:hypothetical protein
METSRRLSSTRLKILLSSDPTDLTGRGTSMTTWAVPSRTFSSPWRWIEKLLPKL